jgi:hypothetical protein
MADPQPLPTDAPGGDEHRELDKRQEYREVRGRIKELRETIQVLGSRRKTLEARQAELAAELGGTKRAK